MTTNLIKKIAIQKANRFRAAFTVESEDIFYKPGGGAIHPGEFGMYREDVVKEFLKSFLPGNREIGSGFLVTNSGDISNQSDIVIYDALHTPIITDDKKQKFFPIETVCGIGEIKSNPDKQEFKDTLIKLAKVKQMREDSCKVVISRDPCLIGKEINFKETLYDQVYTFLVCKKLNFDINALMNASSDIFDDIESHFRPNLVFSFENGIFGYKDENGKFLYHPYVKQKNLPIVKGNFTDDALIFGAYTFAAINSTTIFHPDLIMYFTESSV